MGMRHISKDVAQGDVAHDTGRGGLTGAAKAGRGWQGARSGSSRPANAQKPATKK